MRTSIIPVGHVNVQLIDRGDAIVRMMQNGKEWESQTRKMWGELVQQCGPDDMILDVGAYTGVYAIASALMGWKVMALEPHPMNYARLLMNCALNSMRVDARPMAASSVNSTRTLYMKKRINDTASLDHANADPLALIALKCQRGASMICPWLMHALA
jgi:ribosomal protein L11 methylase PrmA